MNWHITNQTTFARATRLLGKSCLRGYVVMPVVDFIAHVNGGSDG